MTKSPFIFFSKSTRIYKVQRHLSHPNFKNGRMKYSYWYSQSKLQPALQHQKLNHQPITLTVQKKENSDAQKKKVCCWLRRVNKPYTFTLKPQEVQQRIFSCLPTIIPPLKKKIKRKIIKSCCFPQQICITKSKENDEETVNEIRCGTGRRRGLLYEIPWLNCAALQIKFYPGNEQQVVLKDDSLAGSSETRDIMGNTQTLQL